MDYEIMDIDEPLSNISWRGDMITCLQKNSKQVIKGLKLYDNLQSHILVLIEELASSPSTQLRQLLEKFVRIRDE